MKIIILNKEGPSPYYVSAKNITYFTPGPGGGTYVYLTSGLMIFTKNSCEEIRTRLEWDDTELTAQNENPQI